MFGVGVVLGVALSILVVVVFEYSPKRRSKGE